MANGLSGFNETLEKERLIPIHPLCFTFIQYCETLGYGEIEKLKIQDDLPMIAEEVRRKIKFSPEWRKDDGHRKIGN